ncbi:MAG: PAS domain-containing protein [candidate division Zixibacteria bacterium]|jgi:two-component system sensor histidine kinase PilS (NtrC family)|nr:PAS domain-containing protein [candidate division Zixibacteria bacterium]
MKINFTSIEYSSGLSGRLFWIILSRLIIYGLLFTAYLMFLPSSGIFYTMLIAYGILAIGFLLYVLAFNRRPNENLLKIVIGLQILFEFAFEAILVNRVGGNFSPLLVLFILSIVSTTMVYGLVGTLIAATVAGLFYAAPILYDFSKVMPGVFAASHIRLMGISSDEAFYTIFLHLCLFYLIAFISGYMAENLLFASKELHKIRLETDEILENMRSGIITVDASGRIIYFNKSAGDILGVSPEMVRHADYKNVLLAKFPELYYKIEIALTTGYFENRSEILVAGGDRTIPLGISTSVLKEEKGEIRGVIAVFQDLEEVKQMEKRLRDADRMAAIGQLSAGIAHEIRNPLAAISGSVEVLKDSLKPENEQDKILLDLILKESSRLNRILSEFLSFAKISGMPGQQTDLVPVIDEVIQLSRSHPDFKEGLTIDFTPPLQPAMARGDSDIFKQLLWNLLINAAQALGEAPGKITINCDTFVEPGGKVWTKLTVKDNGPGIPPNIRDRVFTPFFSTKSDGTGLGLAIVSRIVESLEGKIVFDTGEWGTKFTILIPPDADKSMTNNKINQAVKV